ncbi:MAG TPA: DUF1786 domain-containing protein [Verrucomicrobiae bacterium]|nr:DUF1786 domain-containing protein [Verrucomicrobiae bacterium]
MAEPVIAIDVGSGTQDILLFLPGKNPENCPKLVMPSRTQIVAGQIRAATRRGEDVALGGNLMGGGACTVAIKEHLKSGRKAFVTPRAGKTFNDNLEIVRAMGLNVVDILPKTAREITLGDVDKLALRQALEAFGLELPAKFAVAVQDHGESQGMGNREFRFKLWQDFILEGGELERLIYPAAPAYYTRMQSIQAIEPTAWVMDTGPAAVWGMLCDPVVGARREQGFIALNIGNSHTLGVAVKGKRILGMFEHHTGLINPDFLAEQVKKFMTGTMTNAEVYGAGGHGAFIHPDYKGDFEFVALTGPRWDMARGFDYYRVAPFGDMMLTGCFGLLAAMGVISAGC